MPKFRSITYTDGGSDILRTRAATASRIRQHLASSFTTADSYATVTSNSLGYVALTAGDIVSSGASAATRVTTFAAKTITLTAGFSGVATAVHVVIVDSVSSEVLAACPLTSITPSPPMSAGGTVDVPAWTDSIPQPA